MTRGLAIALLGCIVLTAASARSDGAAPSDSFDYLYVRAHEGDASGGHAAIRFGAWTYDFQHDAGWLTPRREEREHVVARSGLGILQLPFDRGRGLRDGLDGALWSVPELFFANIRKGTSEYVLPELRPPPG